MEPQASLSFVLGYLFSRVARGEVAHGPFIYVSRGHFPYRSHSRVRRKASRPTELRAVSKPLSQDL